MPVTTSRALPITAFALGTFVLSAVVLGACAGGATSTSPKDTAAHTQACRVQLAPRVASQEGATQPVRTPSARSSSAGNTVAPSAGGAAAPSRIVVQGELDLDRVRRELEGQIGTRVAEARGISLGPAGALEYQVDRGPLALSVAGEMLRVRSPLTARAQACMRGSCYASCAPRADLQVEIPLRLAADYGFQPAKATLDFTEGCRVRALGGLVNVDVTSTLQGQIAPALRQVEREIARHLPALRPIVARAWAELVQAREVPLLGCLTMAPERIVQGPVQAQGGTLKFRFALHAAPELRPRCMTKAAASLPPLGYDRALPAISDVSLGFMTPLDRLASTFHAEAADIEGLRAHIEHMRITTRGDHLQADLALDGEVCGEVALQAALAWSEDGHTLRLVSPRFEAKESQRLAAASVQPASLAAAITHATQFEMPLHGSLIQVLLNSLGTALSDESLEVEITTSSVTPTSVRIHDTELTAWMRLRGEVVLRPH